MSRIDPSTVLAPVLDEVSHMTFVYFLIGALIIYIAWRSTFVRHEARNIPYRQRTVFIFNPQTGDFQQHSLGLLLNNLNNNFAQTTPTFESILDEMNGITYQSPPPQQDEIIDDDSIIEEETQEIIREMDREPNNLFDNQNVLRNRRTNTGPGNNNNTFINNNNNEQIGRSTDRLDSVGMNTTGTGFDTENRTNGLSTNPEENVQSTSVGAAVENKSIATIEATYSSSNEITIKLKYLNDDLKIVKAKSNEPIGDFKKRNFNEELNAQKLVRLVFNGHVLQPDAKTIAACGLFDNCVVHCLIHNPRPNTVTEPNSLANNQPNPLSNEGIEVAEQMGINNLMNSNQNRNRNTQRLLNLSLFLICLSVVISWFFRIQYFQIFSWYSTVGLVLLTTFFLIIIPLIFLIEREIFRNL